MNQLYFVKPSLSVSRFRLFQIFLFIVLSVSSLPTITAQCPGMTAPSSIAGDDCVLYGTSLSVAGGTLGPNGIYQWGTGTVPGLNIIASGQWTTSQYVSPEVATTYWLRIYNASTSCATSAVFKTVTKLSTQPDDIEWIAPVCSGTPFTLKAVGGLHGSNASFQWGTGAVGSNIIASQTGSIGTFTATSNTTFWVRRVDGAPCNVVTGARTFNVSVIQDTSTPPTSISSSKVFPLCPDGGGATLTAVGGASASGATYQWGTGNVVGLNILPGQENQSMYVPGSTTTTYWVRRLSASPCGSPTNGVTLTVPVTTYSTTPTGITSAPACGGGFSLTAVGGTLAPGATYQWGTGYSVGTNSINGENGISITVNPTSQTVYWVRTVDPAPCYQSWVWGPTLVVNPTSPAANSTAPTTISGVIAICQGSSTTLTASGGTMVSGATYQWGSGDVIPQNIIPGATTAAINVSPAATTVYWVRRVGASPCNSVTAAKLVTVTVTTKSTAPTAITGTDLICKGTSTTLTAEGAILGSNAIYQWGTGAFGVGTVIATTASITVSPTATTTYWVRIKDQGSCNTLTAGVTFPVTVAVPSTAPTGISGNLSVCISTATTLTATGGTHAAGSVYEWGTGNVVGDNILVGQNAVSITVSPSVATTYWVRRLSASPCGATAGVSAQVNVTVPEGDQVTYGVGNSWIAYIYSPIVVSPPADNFSENYRGYYGIPETFDYDIGNSSVNGPTMCGSYNNNIAVRFKMHKIFPAGYYTFTVGGDDGYRLSIDGGVSWIVSNWSQHLYQTSTTSTIYLDGSTYMVMEYYDWDNQARASFKYTYCRPSTPPTGITSPSVVCAPSGNITLTATGGTMGTHATYQWGSGPIPGNNIIAGTGASITVNPASTTTTYWVRRVDGGLCNLITDAAIKTITVNLPSAAPTSLTGTTAICAGSNTTLTAGGGFIAPGAVYQWGTGAVSTANSIPDETGETITVSPLISTTYWVRRVDLSPCNTPTTTKTITVTVTPMSTAPTSITGNNLICKGSATLLTAVGGFLGSTASTYQWGTGTVPGSGVLSGNVASISVVPTAATTYWVRIKILGTCNTFTDAVFYTVDVMTPSAAPSTISGTNLICPGQSTTLTASGGLTSEGATFEWGTGSVGTNIIAGEIDNIITVTPSVTTTYWVRKIDVSPCTTPTTAKTIVVTVSGLSTAPDLTAASEIICKGNSTMLTASGGTMGTNASYQWGTGSTAGVNPLSGTTPTRSVNPTVTTTYWVRRVDTACNQPTDAAFVTITVNTPSTAPTTLTTTASTLCAGTPITLTAGGGILGTGGVFEWGFGTTGSNIIDGETGNTLTVSPTTTTTYWVRRLDSAPCNTTTAAKTISINVTAPSTAPDLVSGSLSICKGSSTTLTVSGGIMASGANYQWGIGTTVGAGTFFATTATITVSPLTTTTYWVRRKDNGTCSAVTAGIIFTVTVANPSTAPTTLTSTAVGCIGEEITLTAGGGTMGSNGNYQWGTGSVGSNIFDGESAATLTVSPTINTTYWVRRIDTSPCVLTTGAMSLPITVTPLTIAGTLSAPTTAICNNTVPGNITLSGNIGSVIKWQSAANANFTANVIDIASTSSILPSSLIGPLTSTRYFRAVVQNGGCTVENTAPIAITIATPVTFSGSTWSSTPNASTPVIITSNMTLDASLEVCSCKISGTATLTIPSGVTLTVTNDIFVTPNANIIVENNGSIVQINDAASNTGSIKVKRNTSPMKLYDFTYWSSPVQGVTLHDLSPNTLWDKYYSFDPIINNWVINPNGTAIMAPSKGYIVRAPQGWSLTNATQGIYNGEFLGTPNNGIIPVNIQKGAGTLNLIGNPYPSAIDIDAFLLDPANENILKGTIYLWTHNTAVSNSIPGNGASNYTADDYAKYNITGGIKTASAALTGTVAPTGKIASGQAFFIEANPALANGTYNATFNNSMRIESNNNQFFRSPSPYSQTVTTIEKHRIWLNISNTLGAYDETLLGYIQGATNSLDNRYDGAVMPAGNVVGMYSILDTNKLAIQGRSLPFDQNEVVPLGYRSAIAGTFTIGIEDVDGLFDSQNIYLVDKTNNSYHDLNQSGYSFTTVAGTFDNRFELRFVNASLGTDNPIAAESNLIVIGNGKQINITSGNNLMNSVEVFDLTGKILYKKNTINSSEFETPELNVATQVVLVRVALDDNKSVSKKIILN